MLRIPKDHPSNSEIDTTDFQFFFDKYLQSRRNDVTYNSGGVTNYETAPYVISEMRVQDVMRCNLPKYSRALLLRNLSLEKNVKSPSVVDYIVARSKLVQTLLVQDRFCVSPEFRENADTHIRRVKETRSIRIGMLRGLQQDSPQLLMIVEAHVSRQSLSPGLSHFQTSVPF
ncbi:hypothetical protein IV203_000430 [Nitzschia inconspicua]|uniref:Uncharacterized protein n=1 Tax=Nitzschia inconspicua TaxID=303405 RepID=A0A9K3L4U2_9STRA|nr:hypothetical protein IV203_000430 [Nitzschia inconspicua]